MNKAKPKKSCPIGMLTQDEKSSSEPNPKGATLEWSSGYASGYYVTVSHAAKDWNVSTRRIRTLLASGRLFGMTKADGTWQVRFPYAFTFGTRGPGLKRQQKPPKRPRLVVDNTERRQE